MASDYENLAMFLFERRYGYLLTVHRKQMKKHMLSAMEAGPEASPDEHYDAIQRMRGIPDGMTCIPAALAPQLGLPEIDCIVAIEAEHSSPISLAKLIEYAEVWGAFDSASEHWEFAVMVVDHYGGQRLLDLEGVWMWKCLSNGQEGSG